MARAQGARAQMALAVRDDLWHPAHWRLHPGMPYGDIEPWAEQAACRRQSFGLWARTA